MAIEIKTPTNTYNIDIRLGTPDDVKGLVDLNARWQLALQNNNTTPGFLSVRFDCNTFKSLVESKEVVVGISNNVVISYYIVINFSNDGSLFPHEQIVNELKEKLIIPHASNVGHRAQALVDKPFQGTSIRRLMLDELIYNVKSKYDYLFSKISKNNPRAFKAHTNDGWQVVDETEDKYYVILKLN